jgi:hypothetical protein
MKFLLILTFFVVHSLFAEIIFFKDGTIKQVKLKSQDSDSVTYLFKGKEIKSPKSTIRRIFYAKTPEQENKLAQDELKKWKDEKTKKVQKTEAQEKEEALQLEEELKAAILEKERQERLNLSFEDRISQLEKNLDQLRSSSGYGDSQKFVQMEKDIADLKKRTRKIENFLGIDPDIEEYYGKPRNFWSPIWRSALLPGFGLTYAKSNFGTVYTSIFTIAAIAVVANQSTLKTAKTNLDYNLLYNQVLFPTAIDTFMQSSTTLANENKAEIQSLNSLNKNLQIFKYLKSSNDYQTLVENHEKLIRAAFGIYVIQLIHTAIYSYFWSSHPPQKINDVDKGTGWRFQYIPNSPQTNATYLPSWNMSVEYWIQF